MPPKGAPEPATSEAGVAREAWGILASLVYPPRFLEIARELGITPAGLGAVRFLDAPHTMGEIANFLGCDPSNVTGIVDGLEDKGLASRRPSDSDRRVKLIELTATGERTRVRIVEALAVAPEWIEELSAKDRRGLRDIVRRAAEARHRAAAEAGH
jgi:DNA-binding MarR family transcriptional regulator